MLLILLNFFTVYFIIPSIKDNKFKDDPLIPKSEIPLALPKQRLITPYETMSFIENLVKPIPMNEKIQMLNEMSDNISNFSNMNLNLSTDNKTENSENIKNRKNTAKKDFKIWEYCYRIIKRFI